MFMFLLQPHSFSACSPDRCMAQSTVGGVCLPTLKLSTATTDCSCFVVHVYNVSKWPRLRADKPLLLLCLERWLKLVVLRLP